MLKNILSTLALTGMLFGTVVTPVIAAPSLVTYQNAAGQDVQANYLNALTHAPMKIALTNALSSAELANWPIIVTDDSGKFINYTAAINKNENYATALNDSTVISGVGPWAAYVMNLDGTVTPVQGSNINAIDTTKTTAIYGMSNDVNVKVYLLSDVTPASVTSVTLADGTVLPYNVTNGDYEKDITYTAYGSAPTSVNIVVNTVNGTQTITQTVNGAVTSASVIDGTITVTLSSPSPWQVTPIVPAIADFAVTASGVAVTPTAISTTGAVVTLTVPTVVPTATDQPVYSVSYKGEDQVVANTQVSSTASNNVKVGQNFNVVYEENTRDRGGVPTCTANNESIKSVQESISLIYFDMGGSINMNSQYLLVYTFHVTQTGNFNVQFSNGVSTIDYIVNVT